MNSKNDRWNNELKNATSSYKSIPAWMKKIEEKTRKPKTGQYIIANQHPNQSSSIKESHSKN